jgi:Uma2 family endonuclease
VLVLDTTRVALDQNTTPECIVAVDILSPSDRRRIGRGQARTIEVKLDRYRHLPSCRAVILIEQDTPSVTLYLRTEGTWLEQQVTGLDAELSVPFLGLRCRLRDIYRRTPVAASNA